MHAIAGAVRLDNSLSQHRTGFLDDDYAEYIETVVANRYPQWVQLGILEYGFRPGFFEEARKLSERKSGD